MCCRCVTYRVCVVHAYILLFENELNDYRTTQDKTRLRVFSAAVLNMAIYERRE